MTSMIHLACLIAVLSGSSAAPSTKSLPRLASFTRMIEGKDTSRTRTVQIARAVFRHRGLGRTVVLEGVGHIAEKAFYQHMEARLAKYDKVLYELVGSPMTGKPLNPEDETEEFSLQRKMARSMGLSFQLEGIDYRKSNFVWADLSGEEFLKLAGLENGSDLAFFGALVASALQQSFSMNSQQDAKIEKLVNELVSDLWSMITTSTLSSKKLMWVMARLLAETDLSLDGIVSPRLQNALCTAREARAFEVLARTFEGLPHATASILYGAGHMPAMQDRLTKQGYVLESVTWETAWSGAGK